MRFASLSQPFNLLLLGLLLALSLYTALGGPWWPLVPIGEEPHTTALSVVNYVGFLAIAGCCLCYAAFRRFFRLALGGTLLLALFNLLSFLPFTTWAGLSFGEVRVGINPLILLLAAGFYCFNRTTANAFIRRHLLPAPTPQQAADQYREAIDQFKQTFTRKSDAALQQIVQERQLVAAAVTAGQELLSERRGAAAVATG